MARILHARVDKETERRLEALKRRLGIPRTFAHLFQLSGLLPQNDLSLLSVTGQEESP